MEKRLARIVYQNEDGAEWYRIEYKIGAKDDWNMEVAFPIRSTDKGDVISFEVVPTIIRLIDRGFKFYPRITVEADEQEGFTEDGEDVKQS